MMISKSLLLLVLSAIVLRLVLSFFIYSGDLNNHVAWGTSILDRGFQGGYSREYVGVMQPTYPPVALYSFTTSVGFYRIVSGLTHSLNQSVPLFPSRLVWMIEDQDVLPAFTKITTILADIGIGVVIYRLIRTVLHKPPHIAFWATASYLFNPAVWYVSSLWGQVESLPLLFILLAYSAIFQRRPYLSHAFFILALLSKQSSILFIPIFVLMSWRFFGLKKTAIGLLIQFGIFYALYLPFATSISPVWPVSVYLDRLQTGSGSNWITDHAFNAWIWVSHLQKIPDFTPVLFGLSASLIGSVVFLSLSAVVFYRFIRARLTASHLFLISGLVPAVAFLVLTKMHERYFAPVLPFVLLSTVSRPSLWPVYLVLSTAHLANLYHEWWYPRITPLDSWLSSWPAIQLVALSFIVSTGVIYYHYLGETRNNG